MLGISPSLGLEHVARVHRVLGTQYEPSYWAYDYEQGQNMFLKPIVGLCKKKKKKQIKQIFKNINKS
jgi:hypothetical protein